MKLLPYPKYKQSGVEWLGEVPAHWEVRTLTSIANEITTGPFGSQLHASEYVQDGIPVVNPAHIVAGSIRPDILSSVDDATALRLERHRLKQHDVIVGRRGEIGRCAVVGRQEDGWLCGTGALVVRLHNSDPRYILAVFSGAGFREVLSLNAVGTTMLNLNPMIVGRMLSPVPPLPEQRAIADFLHRETSRLDTLVAKKRTLIERLREKRSALISRAVTRGLPPDAARAAGLDPDPKLKPSGIKWLGDVPEHWDVVPVGRKIVLQRGYDITKDQQQEGGVPVVSSGGVSSFHDEALVQPPGVVVGRKGTAGAVYYIAVDFWPHDTTLYVSEFFENDVRYAYFKLLSMDLASFDTGSANPTVNRNLVHAVIVSWPPVVEQRAIAEFLDREIVRLDTLVTKIETAIERLHEYRAALITAAVTGKIDVRRTVVREEDAA